MIVQASESDRFLASLDPVYVASTRAEREEIYRFRYEVYVEEFGFKVGGTDPVRRWLYDDEDDLPNCQHYYTAEDGRVTGSIRSLNWGPGQVPQEIARAYSMECFAGLETLGTRELGRMAVRPNLRGKFHTVSLLSGMVEHGLEPLGIDVVFTQCDPGLVPHYLRLGWRPYAGRLVPSPDGLLVPLVMFPSDIEHYEAIGSFLALVCSRHFGPERRRAVDVSRYSPLFHADASAVVADEAAVWERVCQQLTGDEQRSFLQRSDPGTAQRFVRCGFSMTVSAGELLLERGMVQQELFVVLDGVFEAWHEDRIIGVMTKGDVFGEFAFFHASGRRIASVRAVTDGQLLVIRRRFLEELSREDPKGATQILFQLGRALADRVDRLLGSPF